MWSLLWKALSWLAGRLFGSTPAPSQEAVQAKEAGRAEASLQVQEQANDEVRKALDASRAVDVQLARDPGGVFVDDGYKRAD